ncbi:hypothetical protein B8W69_02875 [Mycobacterium vulneris]|uniref:Uncharacterized protein n=1 Tax=Mycolicibacterium vulneris TaxID=547163 RepID=A0A1X2LDN4_9MYCO|nr:hypothetical protein [Mycolicibacterium vulneris]OSC32057.1 hypothetical protein B8W69_02875 [Mycolicibacterium vulneris]
MEGTYWLTVLPETSKLRPQVKKVLSGVDSDAVIRPTIDTKARSGADKKAGPGAESQMRGGLGKLLRIEGPAPPARMRAARFNADIEGVDP